MKRLIYIIALLLININLANTSYEEKNLENFNNSCYEKIWSIKDVFNTENSIKVNLPYNIEFKIIQEDKELNYKKIWNKEENIDFSIEWLNDIENIKDNNNKTYIDIDIYKDYELIIKLDKSFNAWSHYYSDNLQTNYYNKEYYISNDNINYEKVSINNIDNFDFSYLKIKFICKNNNCIKENIKIYDININWTFDQYLLKPFYVNKDIFFYSDYKCNFWENYYNSFYQQVDIWSQIDTETYFVNLSKNPEYNTNLELDSDNDWINDKVDNCKNNFNPDQKDSNSDNIWDVCSDVDNDNIIWYKDNCPYISNPKQEDVNNNQVWDACEFDKDKDWIFDSKDNCISSYNPDQIDKDKDSIWDSCDNCKLFNPNQLDKNQNWIWDLCEEKEKQLVDNDMDSDWVIDYKDNCKETYNPNQEDYDKDWVWDLCDNCKDIKNKKQEDTDDNKIWDLCEDTDKDWYVWYLDNCVYINNPVQSDDDNNWIWNLCEDKDKDNIYFINDNCPFNYNPDQKDLDRDNIGDICDTNDDRIIESNKIIFIIIILLVTWVFMTAIFKLIKKLN